MTVTINYTVVYGFFIMSGLILSFPYSYIGVLPLIYFILFIPTNYSIEYSNIIFSVFILLGITTGYLIKAKKRLFLGITLLGVLSLIFITYTIFSKPTFEKKINNSKFNNIIDKLNANKEFESLNCTSFQFSKDTIYLINFTQTFCLPCMQKDPNLKVIAVFFKSKPFKIVHIFSSRDKKADLPNFEKKMVYLQDKNNALFTSLNVSSFPTELLLNSKGSIVRKLISYNKEWNSNYTSSTIELITKLLNEKNKIPV